MADGEVAGGQVEQVVGVKGELDVCQSKSSPKTTVATQASTWPLAFTVSNKQTLKRSGQVLT